MALPFISGLIIGVAGSAHCAGMCGPLCLALPLQHNKTSSRVWKLSVYQVGRVLTYSMIGLLIGSLGTVFSLSGFTRWFSIILGGLLSLAAIGYFFQNRFPSPAFMHRFFSAIQTGIAGLLKRGDRYPVVFMTGVLNGFLPCGMVYLALVYGLSFGNPLHTMGFMAMFGLGTVPVMMISSLGFFHFRKYVNKYLRPAIPVMIGLMGTLLLLRGLNLGIPVLSPFLPSAPGESLNCHP